MSVVVTIPSKSRKSLALFLRRTGELLILTGIPCLGWYLFTCVEARIYRVYEEARLDQALKGYRGWRSLPPRPRNAGDFVGEIDIPRIGLQAVVVEGASESSLRLGVGHIPGTALPGEVGNVSLAGHRDTVFHTRRHIRRDDEIRLTTFGGTCRYRVDWARVVRPGDIQVLEPLGFRALTLVTCYPFYYVGSAPNRFVVRAHQVAG